MPSVHLLFITGAIGWLVGCGTTTAPNAAPDGGTSGVETPATAADIEALCRATCRSEQRCSDSASCDPTCTSRFGDNPTLLSHEALAIATNCFDDPGCLGEKECDDRVGLRDPAILPEVQQCEGFVNSCPMEVNVSDCLDLIILLPSSRAKVKGCYSGTCTRQTQFATCFHDSLVGD